MAALAAQGYEPVRTEGEIRLRNCPFHALATEHRELVCGMNLDLIRGVVDALEVPGVRAVLDPQPEMCCVALTGPRRRRVRFPGRSAGRDSIA
jgi:predicted ArsR family transcriptional regulator